ncbi:MAG: 1-deoxy-D-xylulose-5-phosphate synthase [Proteobacteria bacterium]|nr:1-deoxy-D-xylulose-5-phosphate synthase [Pseudomonadota bacterium]
MSERLLDRIEIPADLRAMPREDVGRVCEELRQEIVQRVAKSGGHLASSLGAVELITAVHAVFDTPIDRLVLDVGHQGYAHKMLTGRRAGFERIGKEGGIGKFLRRDESAYDHFGAGHAGTSISAALGIARAKQHRGEPGNAIALIGDGGMTSGMAFEALNHAGELQQKNLLVILNDNEMSIAPNVGALSSFLSRKMSKPMVRRLKSYVKEFLGTLPGDLVEWAHKAEESFKAFISPSLLFEALGFRYLGPIRGNRIEDVLETLDNARRMLAGGEGPILLHALTAKGFGYAPAEADPFKYHGVTPFEIESGEMRKSAAGPPSYTKVFSDALIQLASEDPRIVAITAAMPDGTGLDRFQKVHPGRYYDVGIAEQHAVTFAAGLAVVMAPKDENELRHMLKTAIEHPGPAAIRYPRGAGFGVSLDAECKTIPIGESELLRDGDEVVVLALGTLAHVALEAAHALHAEGISAAVVNARFAKPLDTKRIVALARRCRAVVTIEEAAAAGGFGSAVLESLAEAGVAVPVHCLAIPDRIIEHGDPVAIRAALGLDAEGIARAARRLVKPS